jgi:hypothetical protein
MMSMRRSTLGFMRPELGILLIGLLVIWFEIHSLKSRIGLLEANMLSLFTVTVNKVDFQAQKIDLMRRENHEKNGALLPRNTSPEPSNRQDDKDGNHQDAK